MSLTENDTEPKVKKSATDNDDHSLDEREEGNQEDRLSTLPDYLLLYLMTFVGTRDSVRTSVLSTRFKDLWKRVPSLKLHSSDFEDNRLSRSLEFLHDFLVFRDGHFPLYTLDLYPDGSIPQEQLTRVLRYAVLHDIRHLKLYFGSRSYFPPCILSCRTLTCLELSARIQYSNATFPESLNLTALTDLRIRKFTFQGHCDQAMDPFSSLVKLKTLVLDHSFVTGARAFHITNATLISLTIHAFPVSGPGTRMVLSAPSLRSFAFRGVVSKRLSVSNVSSLEEVSIDFNEEVQWWGHLQLGYILISWLQVLANVKSLTVSSSALKLLSIIPDLLKTETLCLDNLKSLIVKAKKPSPLHHKPPRGEAELESPSLVPDGVVDYLIRSSPSAKVSIRNC